jgi:hypothetical protein
VFSLSIIVAATPPSRFSASLWQESQASWPFFSDETTMS